MHTSDAPLSIRELNPVLRESEAAEVFRIKRKTLQAYRYAGMLKGACTVIGRNVLYDTAKLHKFLFSIENHNAS